MYLSESVLPFFAIIPTGYLTVRIGLREEWFVDHDGSWVNRSTTRLEVTTVTSNGADYCEEIESVVTVTTTTTMNSNATEIATFIDAVTTKTISVDEVEVTLYPEVIILVDHVLVERGNALPPVYVWPTVIDDDSVVDTGEEPVDAEVLEVDFRMLGGEVEYDPEDAPTEEIEIDWSRVPRI